ncbi:metal ABC transporter ATP-binding protein [Lacibacterium aquatile]|uniref:Metal ABC transporter ATP-binding protein n=1 Tax=Lacibacterium aquatile TaxID=1168082 RepID=A0ABW5DN26_9PROT
MSTITLDNLTLTYQRHPAIHHVSGSFETGSMTAIVGPNGAGKSSLLKAIVGLMPPSGGHVRLQGCERRDIAYLPQSAEMDRSFPLSVMDCVLMGAWRTVGPFRSLGKAAQRDALAALAAVGLSGFERRMIAELSAGQFQRVLFARVMVQDAPVILLDEPFNAIDARTTADLLTLVRRWHGEQRTIIAVLHDMEQVRLNFPRTLMVARELIGWGSTEETLTPANLSRARARSEAWDDHADICAA